jgi:hypothetical protein
MTFERDIRLVVDFNAAKADGTIIAAARYAYPTHPDQGDQVTLVDPEGNSCRALVKSIDASRGTLLCHLDALTWRPAKPLHWSEQNPEQTLQYAAR